MDVQYLTTDDYFAIASRILEIDAGILARRSGQEGLTTIGSALAAPATGWGTVDLYETWPRKIGVLGWRLATRQVLPDGNKRTAFLCMVLFARRNGFEWPDLDTDEVVHVMTLWAPASSTRRNSSGGSAASSTIGRGGPARTPIRAIRVAEPG